MFISSVRFKEVKNIMKTTYKIRLGLTDAEEFVSEVSELESKVDANCGVITVDAKSMIGVMNISNHPLTVTIQSRDRNEILKFAEICKKYEIE